MPSIDTRSIRVPGEMDRCPSHGPDDASRHAGCRSTLDVFGAPESSPVALAPCRRDASNTADAVLFEEDTTLEIEPDSAARLPRDTSLPQSARSIDLCSSQGGLRRRVSTRRSDATRYSQATDVCAIMRHCFNQILGLIITDWITNSSWRRWRTCLPFLICLLCTTQCTARSCSVGLSTPGWTWPQGDIVIEHGKPLRMFCLLNQTIVNRDYPNKDAGDLRFFRNDQELESEFVTVINETTIELFIKTPPASDDMYNCKLKINNSDYIAVCLNKVVVGYPPQKPKHFDCASYNWESFNCTWEPEHNYVHTTYDLMFQLPGRSGAMYYCPITKTKKNSCMWDIYSDPIYRQPYSFYIFTLNVSNAFGNVNFTYRVQHYPNVIPAKPYNLTLINKTSESALLYWELPFPMATFPVGVHHKIMYQHQWDHEKDWKIINITHPKAREHWLYNLTGLEYANTVYDVRIYLKSSTAIRTDRWSDFSVVTFRTSAKLPGAAPRTDIGSFEITENPGNRDVYLYWQAIPQNQENGDNFKYQIVRVEENGRTVALTPSETTRTYAKVKGISLNSYLFEIISTNEVGANGDRARIYVPNQQEIPHELIAFTKIAFEHGLYELSWKPPIVEHNIMNYTIFWCDNERDRPYQCTGYLDWVHVSKNTTIYNITVPDPSKVYQFAISVNTERGSSGMIWSSCTVIHNKVLGKMKSVWINRIGSHFIEVGWKLDCSDRIGIIEGFNIYYCPIMSPLNVNCNGPMLNSTIRADAHTIHGVVENLKPYTTYMLNVAVLTKSGEGLRSDPLYNTTLEAAPSTPPLNVRITDVSNTTMFVAWKKPMAMNGVLRYYEVDYNGQVRKVEEEGSHIKLTNLKPYTRYSIRVSACTVKCSEKSAIVDELTRIGVPGKINIPLVRFVNSSQVIIQWEPPQEPAGPVEAMYYEIEYGNGIIQNVTTTDVQLPIPDCKNVEHREQKHRFRVRAINTNRNGEILKGFWSDFGEGNCYNNGLSYVALVIIWMVGVFSITACMACFVYMFKRMWIKCRAMRDVEVKLPPGLAPGSHADTRLLEKNNELHIRQPSADSSGCSSGQESVTSSLTAESQVCSDSGTEVDAVHAPSDKLKSQPVREMTHLRQRSTTRAPASLLSEVTPCWESSSSYVKVGDSCEAASDETLSLARSTPNLTNSAMSKSYSPSQHAWSSANYISMPSSSEALLSNPSLIPRKNTAGGNSGDCNSSKDGDDTNDVSHGDNNSCDSNNESGDDSGDALISIRFEDEFEKEKQKLTIDELDKMRSIIDINKKIDILASHINPDKMTMATPYVQAGLIDEIPESPSCIPKHIQARNSNLMCGTFKIKDNQNLCKKEYMSFPPAFPTNTTSTSVSPKYIFATIIPEGMTMPAMKDQESSPQKTLHDPHSSTTSDTAYHLASSAHETQSQEQQDKAEPLADVTEDIDEDDSKDNAVHPAASWPTMDATAVDEKELNSSYITLASLSPPSAGPSYVRLEKMSSSLPPQTATSQSDEQYAEVTVVPSTVQ
ncbi:PREDICTED: cytokine receptor [Vollenhovia emeryi]|uniref:cytokine receptor n=1 Tax=Vollenhovia emeryi TaxID=411798 RepID=UPI0005F48034|nr:PREDICTED: cytokine receptor [Vollenhovia emeryi]XP_011874870.1 PREDICTED: cytokine receptor [Vollenhovia emeryi]XP_011874871.1 PREDICTED: cytokine receptor [Vollenhovia emeryi]